MSRYFYYLFVLNMFINTIFFVPRILLAKRYDGAISSILLAIVIGSLLAFLFTSAMNRLNGQGLPEMLEKSFPFAIRAPLLIYFGIMWCAAGSIILIAFSHITQRYLNPDMNPNILLLCYCGIGWWAATFRPMAILNAAEIIILVQLPFVLYIMMKTLLNREFDWDELRVLTDYIWRMPSWTSLAAATYGFTGYINFALYNRLYKNMKVKHRWLIPLLGTSVMFVSIFVPIGLLGVDAVADYLYTWISTADTTRIRFGFVERIVYLFLFIYIGFCLLFIAITWNIGSLLVLSCVKRDNVKIRKHNVSMKTVVCGLFAVVTLVLGMLSNDKRLLEFVTQWLSVRFVSEVFLVALVVWLSWRRKHA
ncbi:hypothetical protein E5161_00770 [Cohnella pontilimi]|uniref:Spore germination protein n=1 Tax=Cohnella pontilimi TaxID=2564100 RepID=A0A4U0FG42_9BACL|nr:GerAB/ArcD/ProY family transporter [Cohnella pontilimi]TJY43966.1 hypothetical protein E5161_00770 [Cohnella pontilimi]